MTKQFSALLCEGNFDHPWTRMEYLTEYAPNGTEYGCPRCGRSILVRVDGVMPEAEVGRERAIGISEE